MAKDLPIHEAAEAGDLAAVRKLLKASPRLVGAVSSAGEQPLHLAAWRNHLAVAKYLLASHANVGARGDRGQTPLHYAARHGAVATADLLIEHGAEVNARDATDFTPAFYAARGRDPECEQILESLLAAGAEVDLNLAVCMGDEARVEEMLAADPKAVKKARWPRDLVLDAVIELNGQVLGELGFGGKPGDHLRVMRKHDGMLRRLLAAGAPIDRPQYGWSPLFHSCQMDHPYVTELLLEHGADPNVTYRGDSLASVLGSSASRGQMLAALKRAGFRG